MTAVVEETAETTKVVEEVAAGRLVEMGVAVTDDVLAIGAAAAATVMTANARLVSLMLAVDSGSNSYE